MKRLFFSVSFVSITILQSNYATADCSISPEGVISSSCIAASNPIYWSIAYQNFTIAAGANVEAEIDATFFGPNHNFTNSGSLSVVGGSAFVSLYPSVSIDNFTNNGRLGTATGTSNAVYLQGIGSITNFTNNGAMLGGGPAISTIDIFNTSIGNFNNTGTISGDIGIKFQNVSIADFINRSTGLITGGSVGILNEAGSITKIDNYGGISGESAIVSRLASANIGTITNFSSGIISSSVAFGKAISIDTTASNLDVLTNHGVISSSLYDAVYASGTVGQVNNYGTISAGRFGFWLKGGALNELNNQLGATISGTTAIKANSGSNTIGLISNSGAIQTTGTDFAIDIGGGYAVNTLANNVTGNMIGGINNGGLSSITTITNSGTINGNTKSSITNAGAVSIITNTGSMFNGSGLAGINNTAAGALITTLNNLQGAGNVNGALTYEGALPVNYNVIVNGPVSYGSLMGSSLSGSTSFGVFSSSTLAVGTYSNVLSGLTSSNITNYSSIYNNWTTFGSTNYQWGLFGNAGCTVACTSWELAVRESIAPPPPPPPGPTDMDSGQTYTTTQLANGLVNPVFNGGTLAVSPSAGTVSVADAFTIRSAGGTIDQNSQQSIFSGVFSDAVNGVSGSLVIANSGSGGRVEMTAQNTYTGSTTINNGATLALGGAGSIATSSGVVVNGTLDIASTNEGASIKSLSGNGAVSTASGKNLTLTNASDTFSGAIGGAGGLTVTGGTETLSGVNTYTGSTQVNGGTLNLTGSLASTAVTVAGGTLTNANGGLASTTNLTVNTGSANMNANQTVANLNGAGGSVAIANGTTLTVSNGGTFAGEVSGAGGIKVASGTMALSGENTHSGGIEVSSGATLSVASGNALGSGRLALVGSPTVAATLEATASTTIGNAITVSGDPVFNVASGTTTTISAPIMDGAESGDVVVAGAGTLNLTAANTYTGATTVTNGATLALTDLGSIANSMGVTNNGTFNVSGASGNVTLNSLTQGASGNLVMSFGAANNQRILVNGVASLAGSLTLAPVAGNYAAGRYSLLYATGGVNGTFSSFNPGSLSAYTSMRYSLAYDANDVYLNLSNPGPSAQNTLQSVQMNTSGLANVINQQAAGLQAGLQYDCTKYDEHNLCISVGGRYTYAGSGPSGNAESGLVIVGYQPSATWRMGGFVDQSVSASVPGNITVGINGPMWGLFNNWYTSKDRLGLNIQGALAFSNNKVTTTRTQLTDTEPGQGTSQMNGQGYQLQANYVKELTNNIKAIPYLGLRYTRINNGAYTENSSTQVTSPLSYNAMAQNTFAALAGLGASAHLAEKLKGTASVGLQQNLNYSMGNYAGTSQIPGLETFSTQMPGNRNTMATASAGVYYDVRKNERIGMNVLWQQQPFINTNTATAIVTYTLGL